MISQPNSNHFLYVRKPSIKFDLCSLSKQPGRFEYVFLTGNLTTQSMHDYFRSFTSDVYAVTGEYDDVAVCVSFFSAPDFLVNWFFFSLKKVGHLVLSYFLFSFFPRLILSRDLNTQKLELLQLKILKLELSTDIKLFHGETKMHSLQFKENLELIFLFQVILTNMKHMNIIISSF